MTYDEAIDATITRDEARAEIGRHCSPEWLDAQWSDFTAECDDRAEYPGSVVLGWLGY